MKTHLTDYFGGISCGTSGGRRKHQAKGVIGGVRAADFKAATDRCMLCERVYLKRRNAQRQKAGKPPVKTPFESGE